MIHLRVVLIDTLGGQGVGARLQVRRPLKGASRVVATVDVVVVQNRGLVSVGGGRASAGRG